MAKRAKPIALQAPLGLDNRSPPTRMPTDDNGQQIAARIAQNIEFYKDGFVRRRPGITLTETLSGAHSGWSHPQWPNQAFVVAGGVLYQVTRTHTNIALTSLISSIGDTPMRYCQLFDRIYATNGLHLIRIKDGAATDLEDEETTLPPTYTAVEPVRRMPAGDHIARHAGRLVVAINQTLWLSESIAPEWRAMRTRFKPMEQPITMLAGIDDGLYIGMDDVTIFAQGADPNTWVRVESYARGAIEGTLTWMPAEWFGGREYGDKGFAPVWRDTDDLLCIGRPGGMVQRPHESRLRRSRPEGGAQLPIERDGLKQIMAQLWGQTGGTNETLDLADQWTTEVISH